MSNEREVVIAASPAEVWRYLSEPELVKKWVGGLVEIEPLNGKELEVGLRDRMVVMMGSSRNELYSEITAVVPERELSSKVVPKDGIRWEEEASFLLDPVNGGTRLRVVAKTRYFGFAKLLAPLITWAAKRKLTEDFARLKQLIEGSTDPKDTAQPVTSRA